MAASAQETGDSERKKRGPQSTVESRKQKAADEGTFADCSGAPVVFDDAADGCHTWFLRRSKSTVEEEIESIMRSWLFWWIGAVAKAARGRRTPYSDAGR
jgi:hypothetical protein